MARSMVSFGMFWLRALSTAVRSRGLLPRSAPPPVRAEIVISRISFVQSFDFLDEVASFLCLILDQRLWPDMASFSYHFPASPDSLTSLESAAAGSASRRVDGRTPPRRAGAARCARSR